MSDPDSENTKIFVQFRGNSNFIFCSIALKNRPGRPTLVSKNVEFSCAFFDLYEKFARGCPPNQTPTQKFKKYRFLTFSSQEIGSSLVSSESIFEALQSELFRLKFHAPSSKILKAPEFNLLIRGDVGDQNVQICHQHRCRRRLCETLSIYFGES